jgi:hypothetical protein
MQKLLSQQGIMPSKGFELVNRIGFEKEGRVIVTFGELVNRDRQFLGLVDRYALLDQISKREEAGSRSAEPVAR